MPYNGLREFLDQLELRGQLKRVKKEVDWNLELSHISWVNDIERKGPALLFENVKDYPDKRVAMSVLTSTERQALALELAPETRFMDVVKHWLGRIGQGISPRWVDSSPCKENILIGDDVNLYDLPAPWTSPMDGGRYLSTAGCLITRNLETGRINLGNYRGMIADRNKMPMLLTVSKDAEVDLRGYAKIGKPMPAAWATGVDPVLWLCSVHTFPPTVSEYDAAGAVRGEPVSVIKGETVDLPIPAGAEIVLEGEIAPGERMPEGPFGEWTGHYTESYPKEFFKVKAITYCNNPILWSTHPFIDSWSTMALTYTAALWSDLQRMGIRGIKIVYRPPAAGAITMAIISIEQMYPGHSTQVGLAAMCSVATHSLKVVIVVDDDIDPEDWEQVAWAIGMRCEPGRGAQIIKRGWTGPLDPSLPIGERVLTSRMLIDACVPYEWERKPERVVPDQEVINKIKSQWDQYFAV